MSKKNLLLVEDNSVNQKVALTYLSRLGYQVDLAIDGQEALSAHAGGQYDLILMDCQMPNMDGYTATQEIRSREGEQAHTPIIAITANATDQDRDRCLQAGMDDYLSKPLEIEALKKTLTAWLS